MGLRREPRRSVATGGATILVVDDEQPLRTVLSLILAREGYSVYVAASAREGAELWEQHRSSVRLLITDIDLGGVSGPEMVSGLSARGCAVPVLYISGACLGDCFEAEPRPKSIRFLRKPFRPDELVVTVREMLDRSCLPKKSTGLEPGLADAHCMPA